MIKTQHAWFCRGALLQFTIVLVLVASFPQTLFAKSIVPFTPGLSWQWQLSGPLNPSHAVDVFDLDLETVTKLQIESLHNRGVKVICYFSAGTIEDFRGDTDSINRRFVGKSLPEWPDERWLDVRHYSRFKSIMLTRLNLAKEKKCDGVEPDNVDAYANDSGFKISKRHQIIYNKWLAKSAHSRGLAIGLKNDLDQVLQLVNYFDFAVNEQCFQYGECEKLLPFIEKNKAVFGVEYELKSEDFCPDARKFSFSWLKMKYELEGDRISCDDGFNN